jgi:hypothetical protein
MKNSIRTLAVASLAAALVTAAAHAAPSRTINQGRAGYALAPPVMGPYSSANRGHATTVALAVEKPQQGPSHIQTAGRAGYLVVPNTTNR